MGLRVDHGPNQNLKQKPREGVPIETHLGFRLVFVGQSPTGLRQMFLGFVHVCSFGESLGFVTYRSAVRYFRPFRLLRQAYLSSTSANGRQVLQSAPSSPRSCKQRSTRYWFLFGMFDAFACFYLLLILLCCSMFAWDVEKKEIKGCTFFGRGGEEDRST